eukprot:186132-Rhodomonas_salina.1
MEAENATLHTKDAALATSAATKKRAWMDAESTYRVAEVLSPSALTFSQAAPTKRSRAKSAAPRIQPGASSPVHPQPARVLTISRPCYLAGASDDCLASFHLRELSVLQ